jgi:hypothetical protein
MTTEMTIPYRTVGDIDGAGGAPSQSVYDPFAKLFWYATAHR